MAVTYRTLYNQALNSIKSTCINVSNFGALPNHFKAGYSTSVSSARATARLTIDNPIYQVSGGTVDNEFNTTMSQFGITGKLDQVVTPRGLINFYSALASFVQAKVCVCQARNSGKYICYESGHGVNNAPSVPDGDLIYATDTNIICNNIIQVIASNAKGRPTYYTTHI